MFQCKCPFISTFVTNLPSLRTKIENTRKICKRCLKKFHALNTWPLFLLRFEVDGSRQRSSRENRSISRRVPRSELFSLDYALEKLFLARSFHLNVLKQPISRHESSKKNTKLRQGQTSCQLLPSEFPDPSRIENEQFSSVKQSNNSVVNC